MKSQLLNKKIPTILGIILVLLVIPLTTFILKGQTILSSRASVSQAPQSLKITNISDRSFTITYLTDAAATGSISYGTDKKLGQSELDESDKKIGSFSPKKIHSISVTNLTPSTKYFLTIISGSNTFLNNGALFETTTGPDISSLSASQNNVRGKIVLPDGSAPPEALVYLNANGSQLLSTPTSKDGTFTFPLKELRTNDLSSYFDTNQSTSFKLMATDGSLMSSASTSLLSQENQLPTITLSNNYNFAQEVLPIASKSAQPSPVGFPSNTPSKKNLKPQIISPKEKQTFNSQKPQFNGTSLPNEKIEIIIHSDEQITASITADGNGNWTYVPPNNLSPGDHTITIKARDSSGILTTIIQSFTVYAAETSPTPIVPPAIPTQGPMPTLLPIPIPTQTPIPSPINGSSSTITMVIPTTTPTPTPIPSPTLAPLQPLQTTSKGGLPPTGTTPTFLIIGGAITTISGLVLFLLTHTVL